MSKRTTSPKKIAANKANGLRSTGPRTPEGKARASQNAVKHGLRSDRHPLDIATQIPDEQTQFSELLADLTASLDPVDPLEMQLVARLAQLSLRLNRAAAMESAALDKARADSLRWAEKFPDDFPNSTDPTFETHIQANTLNRASNQLKLLSQYESRLSRDFARTLTQIRQSQKLRKQTQPFDTSRSLASNGQIAPTGAIANPCHPSDGVVANPVPTDPAEPRVSTSDLSDPPSIPRPPGGPATVRT